MIKTFKHYSFDLWLTLIKSDSRFKVARSTYFYEKHNQFKKSFSEIEKIIREVDIMCTDMNEITGRNISSEEMYYMVLFKLGKDGISIEMINRIQDDMERLFFAYLPEYYDEDTLDVLRELKSRGSTLSITSNTGFIKGKTLRKLIAMKFEDIFEFQIYSDEVGCSKPSSDIFYHVTGGIYSLYEKKQENLPSNIDILHVGDNPIADLQGAKKYGFNSYLLNNGRSIITLL